MNLPMTSSRRSCHNLCNWAVIWDACSCLSSTSHICSIGERSGDLVGQYLYILKDIVRRVAQYVDERCLADKWHLGDLRA
ncbi:hypothetical protein TNCV_2881171 [Trichonephila clavipes]|nr:hypothetical protein TNCV_2881171 [Trichonephila clavipes]